MELWQVVLGIVGYEGMMSTKQMADRKRLYDEAESYARSVGKPFLVVGHPKGRHGCGDISVDIVDGMITECPTFIQANIENMDMFENKQFGSIFVGHVLEHVDDIEKAFFELCRVADKVFIAYPDWYSLTAYLAPDHKWLILSAPPKTDYVEYCRIR
jgi:hypothetical protein